jgi:hypothetical protein
MKVDVFNEMTSLGNVCPRSDNGGKKNAQKYFKNFHR